MTVTEIDICKIKTKIHPLLGKKAWGVSLGVGSFITLEFGARLLSGRRSGGYHGEWHLWVCYCVWRLEEGAEVIVGSEDPRPELEKAIQRMEGLTLQSVILTPPALETTFIFDQDVILRLFPIYYIDEVEHWMLYTPDGNVLSIGPGTSWSYKSETQV